MDDETITNAPQGRGTKSSPPGSPILSGTFGEPDFSGTTLGNYRIVRKLAEGGMGVVYEAVQTKLDRKVALKVLTDNLSSRDEFLKRFEREAKAAAALSHPNLVQVYDFGEAQGRHYLIMEFIEGEDLAQSVQRNGKLTVEEGLNAIEQAALALKAACAKAIIHRDIKPSNIMLTRDGVVKVSDMGLAKILTESTEVTATGVGMGSPHFIAPEQADDSRSVDHRVDIYALGITLLYILTGKKPFDGSSPFSVVLAHANKPLPSGRELGTDLPEAVEGLIRRMSAKKPEERYQDYDTLIADIQRVRAGAAPVQAAPVSTSFASYETGVTAAKTKTIVEESPRGMHPVLLAGIVGVIAAAVVLGGFILFTGKKESTTSVTQLPNTTVADNTAHETQPAPGRRERDFPEANGGPPSDEDSVDIHIARILPPLVEVRDPLADGPVDKMLAAAEKYATDNPENFKTILAGFEQINTKAPNSPEGAKVRELIQTWSARRDEVVDKTIEIYRTKVQELSKTRSHRDAMDYVRTFPNELRSRDVDLRVFQQVAIPPPENERGGGGRRPPQDR